MVTQLSPEGGKNKPRHSRRVEQEDEGQMGLSGRRLEGGLTRKTFCLVRTVRRRRITVSS